MGRLTASLSHRGRLLPDATTAHVDVLQLTNPVLRSTYGKGYVKAVERAPHLVGMMYDLLDRPRASAPVRVAFERLNFTRLTG